MRAGSGRCGNEDLREPEAVSWLRGHEVARGRKGASGGRSSPWCLSGTASRRVRVASMSDSATTSGRDMGAEDRTGGDERCPHPPTCPVWLLSSPRPWRDGIWANLSGYYGNTAPQPLAQWLRDEQPIRSCSRSRDLLPPSTCGRGSGGAGKRRSVGRSETWRWLPLDAVAGTRGDTSGVSLRVPACHCGFPLLPEGESPA